MKLGVAYLGSAADAASVARRAEEAGAEVFLCGETDRLGSICAATAAVATSRIEVGTGVSLAFARSPVLAAMEVNALAELAPGRCFFGLGSQVRQVVQRRFAASFDPPVARMREYVEVLRRVEAAYRGETPEAFEGKHYRVSQYTFHAVVDNDRETVPLYLGAVGPRMLALAAESFDGLIGHGVATRAYLEQRVRPVLGDLPVYSAVMITVDDDVSAARAVARRIVAFYGTTPAYQPTFDVEGRPDLPQQLRRTFREHGLTAATELLDELVSRFVLSGPVEAVVEGLRAYEGVLDTAVLGGVGVGASQAEVLANAEHQIAVVRAYRERYGD